MLSFNDHKIIHLSDYYRFLCNIHYYRVFQLQCVCQHIFKISNAKSQLETRTTVSVYLSLSKAVHEHYKSLNVTV